MTDRITPFDLQQSPLSGRNLVEASAGTGKTYTIEGIFLRLLLENRLSVENILVVTFTEAATSELRERVRHKIQTALLAFETGSSDDDLLNYLLEKTEDHNDGIYRLKSALAQFDEAAISTIHGFCQRELLDHAFESGSRFDSEFIKDQRELLLEIVQDFWRLQLHDENADWILYLMHRFGSPRKLLQKLTGILNRPSARIVPELAGESGEIMDLASFADRAASLFKDLSVSWQTSRVELSDTLLNHPGLNHRSYSKKNVPVWMGAMDAYIAAANPFIAPDKLSWFSMDTIEAKSSGKTDPPHHSVFITCRELEKTLAAIPVMLDQQLITYTQKELKLRKQQRNLLSFDDLLKDLRNALSGAGGDKLAEQIRKKYRVGLIDEFQDTDPVQYDIFNTIFAGPDQPLFFIGDPKQSIYSFRGADIFAYLTARKDAAHAYTLKTNWRSDGDLIKAVNAIFDFRDAPFRFSEIEFIGTGSSPRNPERGLLINDSPEAPFHLWFLDDEGGKIAKPVAKALVTDAVADEIARLLELGNRGQAVIRGQNRNGSREQTELVPGHIAVLVRTHLEAEAIQQALAGRSIPSVMNTHATVFQSEAFKETVVILQAIADAASEKRVKRALVTGLMEVSGEALRALQADENRWEATLEKFQNYRQIWLSSGFYTMIRRFVRNEGIRVRLLGQVRGERKLTNFLHSLELLHEAQNDNRFGMNGLVKWAERQLQEEETGKDEAEIRLETDDRAVKIMTIHASKGLEFPVVFCPFAWGSANRDQVFFHDPENENILTLDLGSAQIEDNRQQARAEILAEEIRLLYVALTRARHRCYLAWGNINRTADSAPAWLFHNGSPAADRILDDLRELERRAEGHILLQRIPEIATDSYAEITGTETALRRLSFRGFGAPDWGVTSFTGLSTRTTGNIESPDRDRIRLTAAADLISAGQEGVHNMFSLPGGTRTGNCFHDLFEHVDFQQKNPALTAELVRDTLNRYELEPHWQPVAIELVNNVLSTPLPDSSRDGALFTLGDVTPRDRLSEMAFYFPLKRVSSGDFSRLLEPFNQNHTAGLLQQTLSHLDFSQIPGFMKGFIDLICCHNGRYYILDWKTNFLGNRPEDYHFNTLQDYMVSHSFVLQYVIYTVALHRMLRVKLDGYDFNTHFGGIFYIFLRGIQDGGQGDFGIYHDSMQGCAGLIEKISCFLGGDQQENA